MPSTRGYYRKALPYSKAGHSFGGNMLYKAAVLGHAELASETACTLQHLVGAPWSEQEPYIWQSVKAQAPWPLQDSLPRAT